MWTRIFLLLCFFGSINITLSSSEIDELPVYVLEVDPVYQTQGIYTIGEPIYWFKRIPREYAPIYYGIKVVNV